MAPVALLDRSDGAGDVEPARTGSASVPEPQVADIEADSEDVVTAGIEAEPAEEVEESATDGAPRRRTVPEPGSAAERAAQRRARIRAQADKKGKG
jgi:hypothetical protein